MSGILRIEIETELDRCKTIMEIENIRKRYFNGFSNDEDISEFNRMIANARTRVLVELSLDR